MKFYEFSKEKTEELLQTELRRTVARGWDTVTCGEPVAQRAVAIRAFLCHANFLCFQAQGKALVIAAITIHE